MTAHAIPSSAAKLLSTGSIRMPRSLMLWNYLKAPRPAGKDNPDAKPKYEISILVPAKADVSVFDEACWALAMTKAKSEKEAKRFNFPLRPIDEESKSGDSIRAALEEAGYDPADFMGWYSVRTEDKPGVVDNKGLDIDWDDDDINDKVYVGVHCFVTVKPFYYKRSGNEGISAALRNVQIIPGAGPKLTKLGSGKPAAKDEFEAVDAAETERPARGSEGARKQRPWD